MFDNDLLFTNGAVTADGNSTDLQVGPGEYTIELNIQAVTGTSPTLDVAIHESDDDSTYNLLASFPQKTAAGVFHRKVATRKEYLRLVYDVGGTSPSFTMVNGIVPAARDRFIS